MQRGSWCKDRLKGTALDAAAHIHKRSFEREFCRRNTSGKFAGALHGFPMQRNPWCNSRLKVSVLNSVGKADLREDILSQDEASWGGQRIYGFPMLRGAWCNSDLKRAALRKLQAGQPDGLPIAQWSSKEERYDNLRFSGTCQNFLPAPLHKERRKILCNISA